MLQTMPTFVTLVVERHKMDSKEFEGPRLTAGRLAHIRRKQATNKCAYQ
jgi:hypothetical protein